MEAVRENLRLLETYSVNIDNNVENKDDIKLGLEILASLERNEFISWNSFYINILQNLRSKFIASLQSFGGRPKLDINCEDVKELVKLGFSLAKASSVVNVSRSTLYRRLKEDNTTIRSCYAALDESEIDDIILEILTIFPNTGYKRMKGYLQSRGVKLQERKIRESMLRVDAEGVHQRKMRSRVILRRQYFVEYANSLWHIDTHMKLIRWKIVIRGGIDGKSRVVVYLEAGNENSSESNLQAFLSGVSKWGVPLRCRSDKGKENVKVAQFMLLNRGLGRGSFITGRSVHNQRIERYWGDVFPALLCTFYNFFLSLEHRNILNVENPVHIAVLHYVFLPRLNDALLDFMNSWNNHPLSTEHNWTPLQLMLANLPPVDSDVPNDELNLPQRDDVPINTENDFDAFNSEIQNPIVEPYHFPEHVQHELRHVNVRSVSHSYGEDIFLAVLSIVQEQRNVGMDIGA